MATKNRWLIALSAVAIHLSIGSAYAYSVFKRPLEDALGWSSTETSLAFTLAIFILGLSAALFGPFVERKGPRVSALLAAVLFAAGHVISGLGVAVGSLVVFYLGYGVVGGVGLGIGYISPVSTLVSWFPDRRGMATGMAVLGFGAGALIASPVAASLIVALGVAQTFFILGAAFLVLMASGASYIAKPPAGWQPAVLVRARPARASSKTSLSSRRRRLVTPYGSGCCG
jgi:OFA family oxalate/formate antiporter-like MFS transporter